MPAAGLRRRPAPVRPSGQERRRHRRRGWLTALLAAGVLVAVAIGGLVVQHRGGGQQAAVLRPVGGPTDAGVAGQLPGTDRPGGAATQRLATDPAVRVAPLTRRVVPDVFVSSGAPLTSRQLSALKSATGARTVLLLDAAPVHLQHGSTVAIGVDPSTFRAYAPKGTAEVTALWESVAGGEAAVAHTVARALQVPLGGHVSMGRTTPADVRVGAYATTGLPGVGVVVDRSQSARFGLIHHAAALLVLPGSPQARGQDAAAATAAAKRAVPGLLAVSLQTLLPDAALTGVRPGSGGWVFPTRGHITQGFKPGVHFGIDIGAPLGTPIYAAAAGYVLYAGPASGFGNEIILQHAGGVQTVYGHMRYLLVTSGPVQAGQQIAVVGDEGRSTGPHLHFEVHVHNTPTDPVAWLIAHGVPVVRS